MRLRLPCSVPAPKQTALAIAAPVARVLLALAADYLRGQAAACLPALGVGFPQVPGVGYPPDPAVDCLRVREAVSPPVQVAAYQPAQAVDYLRAQAAVNPQDQVTIGEPSACRNR